MNIIVEIIVEIITENIVEIIAEIIVENIAEIYCANVTIILPYLFLMFNEALYKFLKNFWGLWGEVASWATGILEWGCGCLPVSTVV